MYKTVIPQVRVPFFSSECFNGVQLKKCVFDRMQNKIYQPQESHYINMIFSNNHSNFHDIQSKNSKLTELRKKFVTFSIYIYAKNQQKVFRTFYRVL